MLPTRTIQRFTSPISHFMHMESAGGLVLLLFTIAALVLANSTLSADFLNFWRTPLGVSFGGFEFTHSLRHWINDGLMALFFFLVGLEVKRELVAGELRTFQSASLPILAAFGGMLVPAGIYLALQSGGEAADGWGMVMATDIAFVVGCMSLVGKGVPRGLKIFILTLAIVDDIGAILVIAIGYTSNVAILPLIVAGVLCAVIVLLIKAGVRSQVVYVPLGVAVWFGFHESGVHATLAGVILGLLTPAQPWLENSKLQTIIQELRQFVTGNSTSSHTLRDAEIATRWMRSPLDRAIETLHPYVSFIIMPLFALANAGVVFNPQMLASPVTIAIMAGLFIGKPVGIALFSFVGVKLGICILPTRVTWAQVLAGGVLAGIGFTMSLFIAGLGLEGTILETAKTGILATSALAALAGILMLFLTTRGEAGKAA